MRAALICLPGPGDAPSPVIAGKTVSQRQLEFARSCGCELVLAHGAGGSEAALQLRHAAESAGMRFTNLSGSHALAGAISLSDSLLVMQSGLLPLSQNAVGMLGAEATILVLPAGAGCQAGFERIDLDRAWAGALIMPGDLLGRISTLAEDAAPASALLRIALQARLPEARLPEQMIDNGDWRIITTAEEAQSHQKLWLRWAIGKSGLGAITQRLASFLLRMRQGWLAGLEKLPIILLSLFGLLVAGAIAAAWFDRAVLGFVALAIAALFGELAIAKARITTAPFDTPRWPLLTRKFGDISLLACSTLAIDSLWFREIFAAFMLLGGLWLLDRREMPGWLEFLRDRGIIAAFIAGGAAFGQSEAAILISATILMLANILPRLTSRG